MGSLPACRGSGGWGALGLLGNRLPFAPRGQARFIVAFCDAERDAAEEYAERRAGRVGDLKDRGAGGGRVAGRRRAGGALPGGLLADLGVVVQGRGAAA